MRERSGYEVGAATLNGLAFCLHCRSPVTLTTASLCACGAFILVGPAPPAFVPLHEMRMSAAAAADSESRHLAEADQTPDGPASLYSATAATMHFVHYVVSGTGGPAPTMYVAGPLGRR